MFCLSSIFVHSSVFIVALHRLYECNIYLFRYNSSFASTWMILCQQLSNVLHFQIFPDQPQCTLSLNGCRDDLGSFLSSSPMQDRFALGGLCLMDGSSYVQRGRFHRGHPNNSGHLGRIWKCKPLFVMDWKMPGPEKPWSRSKDQSKKWMGLPSRRGCRRLWTRLLNLADLGWSRGISRSMHMHLSVCLPTFFSDTSVIAFSKQSSSADSDALPRNNAFLLCIF